MVVVGDPLSTGGAVLPHNHNLDARKGVSFAYINGKVHCDTCNSTGAIAKAGGPSRLNYRGQEVALEGDIVLCNCPVPPTLVAKAVTTSKPSAWADDDVETHGEVPPARPQVDVEGISASSEHGQVTITYADGHKEVRKGGSMAWRNNNPGNMRAGIDGYPAIGSSGGFAVFKSEKFGFEALLANLKTERYQALSVAKAIDAWAPASDSNDPVTYSKRITEWTGIDSKTNLKDLTASQLTAVGSAIRRQEGWIVGTVVQIPKK
ncbi:PAAR domain-containing protein [Rhodoferax sp. GW822-FHT02A01]|uniref:PAAR domain-containing protein n=1 Tax=Rhodoferax sp. GW822-FHT02A01 TaxID=3141537 RepID=UPI00315D1301